MINKSTFLKDINFPSDLRKISEKDLPKVANEVRNEMIDAVSQTGGHLGAGLGVVELTVALHYVFDTPNDKLIWDVGHQSYPHKILTGRKDKIRTLRQGNGLSGFTKRTESEYDPFGAAHSSTSISSALGIAEANKLENKSSNVIAVIGDGAISAGMAYEAMNNAGASKTKMIVIRFEHCGFNITIHLWHVFKRNPTYCSNSFFRINTSTRFLTHTYCSCFFF